MIRLAVRRTRHPRTLDVDGMAIVPTCHYENCRARPTRICVEVAQAIPRKFDQLPDTASNHRWPCSDLLSKHFEAHRVAQISRSEHQVGVCGGGRTSVGDSETLSRAVPR